jgi:hypothetical protein
MVDRCAGGPRRRFGGRAQRRSDFSRFGSPLSILNGKNIHRNFISALLAFDLESGRCIVQAAFVLICVGLCVDSVALAVPDVQMITSQLNRWEAGADLTDSFNPVLFVPLKRPDTCPLGVDQEGHGCDDWRSNPAGTYSALFWRLPLIILLGASLLPLFLNLVRGMHYTLRRRGSRRHTRCD